MRLCNVISCSHLYHAIENTANQNAGKPLCIARRFPPNLSVHQCNSIVSHPTFRLWVKIPASFFQQLFEPFEPSQSQIFHSAALNFEVKISEENEGLNTKTPLTNQEVDVFVEEQRKARTVKKTNSDVSKFVKFIQEPPRSILTADFSCRIE